VNRVDAALLVVLDELNKPTNPGKVRVPLPSTMKLLARINALCADRVSQSSGPNETISLVTK